MAREDTNRLERDSGLLPKGVVELGLDDDGLTAWCTRRGAAEPVATIELDVHQPRIALVDDLVAEHGFTPLLAVEAARRLYAEHRRRSLRH